MASYAARLRGMTRAKDPRLRGLTRTSILALREIADLWDAGTSGKKPRHSSPVFDMSLDTLADRLVCSRPTAKRALRQLRAEGWIRKESGGVGRHKTCRHTPGPAWSEKRGQSDPFSQAAQPAPEPAPEPEKGSSMHRKGVIHAPEKGSPMTPKSQSGTRSHSGVNLTTDSVSSKDSERTTAAQSSDASRAGGALGRSDTSESSDTTKSAQRWAEVIGKMCADLSEEDLDSAAKEMAHRTRRNGAKYPREVLKASAKRERVDVKDYGATLALAWERRNNVYPCDHCGAKGDVIAEGDLCGKCEEELEARAEREREEAEAVDRAERAREQARKEAAEKARKEAEERAARERAEADEREARAALRAVKEDAAWADHRAWERAERERAEPFAYADGFLVQRQSELYAESDGRYFAALREHPEWEPSLDNDLRRHPELDAFLESEAARRETRLVEDLRRWCADNGIAQGVADALLSEHSIPRDDNGTSDHIAPQDLSTLAPLTPTSTEVTA